ncbi:MAG: hypothetical protein EOP56_02120 [Sphingobacteriales bacterium]|nr:MAG: hypothetical protein EOP56_02120 [Sphingobacteriales bacterium]
MQNKDIEVIIESNVVLDSLPSGSGMVVAGSNAWIICDDATGLYSLSLAGDQYHKIAFPQYDTTVYRIPKPVKPDFESAAMGQVNGKDHILAFGSGSLSPHRDSLLLFDPSSEHIRFVSLEPFYNALRQRAQLDSGELNIEGAVITKDHLYLLNRGRNLLFSVSWPQFKKHIEGASELPAFTIHKVALPVSSGLQAGFAGACSLDDNNILFSASLEDTRNSIADGAIYGSYIGILGIDKDSAQVKAITQLKDASGKAVMDKVESLDVIRKNADKSIQLAAIVDNDDGSSKLLILYLSYH